jgi:hypothetical protein
VNRETAESQRRAARRDLDEAADEAAEADAER